MSNAEQKMTTVTQAECVVWQDFYLRQMCMVAPLVRLVKRLSLQAVWIKVRIAETKNALNTGCAAFCFRLHRRFHTRTNLFGRWAGGFLIAARRAGRTRHHLMIGVAVFHASAWQLGVGPKT
ncbi:MAG: hypothetical protein WCD42_05405 [Rhizomicrobium sp.]